MKLQECQLLSPVVGRTTEEPHLDRLYWPSRLTDDGRRLIVRAPGSGQQMVARLDDVDDYTRALQRRIEEELAGVPDDEKHLHIPRVIAECDRRWDTYGGQRSL